MGRAIIIIACGIVLGLAIAWLVMSQVPGDNQQKVQPANANAPYGGARPVAGDPGRR